MLKAKLSGPTPPEVAEAINTIVYYLRDGGWVEVIISDTGGTSFRLESIYNVIASRYLSRGKSRGAVMPKKKGLPKIGETEAFCPAADCRWRGTVDDCAPDVDGDGSLGCPRCYEVVDILLEDLTTTKDRV